MLRKIDKNPQLNIAQIPLIHFVDTNHELCRHVKNMDWAKIENDFADFYSPKGAPSIPIRIMVGIIMLKHVYRYSDKSSLAHWVENPYWQYFCGEVYFQIRTPFYYSDFSHFRKRIGKEGERKILLLGNEIFGASFSRGFGGKKDQPAVRKGLFSGILNRLGSYLVSRTSY